MSVYSRMASLITVEDIMTPLGPDVIYGEPVQEAWERMHECSGGARIPYDPNDRVSLVIRDGKVVSKTYLELMNADMNVGDKGTMEPIDPSLIISSDTKIIRFFERMSLEPFPPIMVLRDDSFVGSICLTDLSKMPFRLCLLALTLDLEQLIMDYAQKNPQVSWDCLPNGRKKVAENLYRKKIRDNPNRPDNNPTIIRLLNCTSYSDKCLILKTSNMMPSFHSLIDKSIEFRNVCAHSTSELEIHDLLKSVSMKEYIIMLRTLNHELRRLIYVR